MRVKGREGDICTEGQRQKQISMLHIASSPINVSKTCCPWFLWKPLKLRVEHRHFLDCNSQAVYLIMMKHETVWANTIIILIAFRIQQIGIAK